MTLAHYNDQMRLTAIDTAINPSTKDLSQPCDPGLYSIYNRNTECPDAHSNTLRIIFVDSIQGKTFDIETDTGEVLHLYQNWGVKVNRNGVEQWVEAKDIQDGDDIIEYKTDPIKQQ